MTLQTLDVEFLRFAERRPDSRGDGPDGDADGLDVFRALRLGIPLSLLLWVAIVAGFIWLI